jgi:methanogenic corrinoid protein MtbC1
MKTAVEFLVETLAENGILHSSDIEQAKEMENQQIENAFEQGAKWQQERMYSEEEVFSIIDKAFHMYASSHRHDAKEWFEQFKKK